MSKQAVQKAVWSLPQLELPSTKWLWRLLGISTGGAAVVVVVHQASDPASLSHQALAHIQERIATAGEEASSWLRSSVTSVGRRSVQPQPLPGASSPASVPGYAARFLADWCSQPERSQLAVALGGGPLLDWLVSAACQQDIQDPTDLAEQEQAQRALAYLMQSDATASLVVERAGAVPRLLRHCKEYLQQQDSSSAAPECPSHEQPLNLLLHALQHRAAAGLASSEPSSSYASRRQWRGDGDDEGDGGHSSIAGMMQWILGGNTTEQEGIARGEAFLSDLEDVLAMLLQDTAAGMELHDTLHLSTSTIQPATPSASIQQLSKQSPAIVTPPVTPDDAAKLRLQQLCAAWLATWAEANSANRDKLTGLNLAAAISHVAAQVSGRSGSEDARALQLQLVRLVAAMAQGPESLSSFVRGDQDVSFASLFQPLTNTPATPTRSPSSHAPATSDSTSPATAQYHLAGCLQPLLYITADAAVEHDTPRAVAALAALRALLLQGGLPVAAVAAEEPLLPLLQKIAQGPGHADLRGAAVRVLAAMAHTPQSLGDSMTVPQLVGTWRDWLLDTVCQDKKGPQQDALRRDCCEALAELAALPGVTGLQVTHYWLASLLACLATRVWPFNAVAYTGPKDQVILPKTTPASKTSPQPPPPTMDGASIDARDFLDAVPVLPSHIASVARALEEASDAVVEEYEPPLDFDLGSAGAAPPLARTFYRQVARTVDVLVAEKRVCEALEVLNALVAADPAKQQWLLSVGIIPLLHRLCTPQSDADATAASSTEDASNGSENSSVNKEGGASGGLAVGGSALGRAFASAASSTGKSIAAYVTSWLPAGLKRTSTSASVDGSGSVQGSAGSSGVNGVVGVEGRDGPEVEAGLEPQETDMGVNNDHEGPSNLCLRRQVARLLALLAVQPSARSEVGGRSWLPWLQQSSQDPDCRLASHATRAILNLEAFRPRGGLDDPAPQSPRHHLGPRLPSRFSPITSRVSPAPVYLDMVHLLNPQDPHLWTLAHYGSRPHSHQLLQRAQPQSADLILSIARSALPTDPSTIPTPLPTSPPAPTNPANPPKPPGALTRMQSTTNSDDQPVSPRMDDSLPSLPLDLLLGESKVPQGRLVTSAASSVITLLSTAATSTLNLAWGVPTSGLSMQPSVDPPTPFQLASSVVAPRVSAADMPVMSTPGGPGADGFMAQTSPVTQGGAGGGMQLMASVLGLSAKAEMVQGVQGWMGGAQVKGDSGSDMSAGTDSLPQPSHALLPVGVDCCGEGVLPVPLQYMPFGTGGGVLGGAASGSVWGKMAGGGGSEGVDGDEGVGSRDDDVSPLIDVVFVHGIRGGPFITWRKPGATVKGSSPARRSAAFLQQSDCWPSDWLPRDAPRARLLTVEYLAPVSGWEGESLPLEATVERVMGQLQAAGVGQRPLVFVAHSMGGLLVKEMLVRSLKAADAVKTMHHPADDEATHNTTQHGPHITSARSPEVTANLERARLVQATQGIVFFATPHFGSGMAAMGWKLRHMPYAAPAPALAQLTPGPHLVELNETLRYLVDTHGLRVISGVEGQPTQLSPVLPKILIVPEASANPGFGELLQLPSDDHISLCKPANRQAPAYTAVLSVIKDVLDKAAAAAEAS